MKKFITILLAITLLLTFGLFALASTSSDDETKTQDSGTVDAGNADNTSIGSYKVDIKSCRLAQDYEGKPIVIVMYGFTNNGENAVSFSGAFTDKVYQDGVELEHCYFVDESANYASDNQNKDIKTGVTLDVEVAYTLNNSTSDIEVEIEEFISFNNTKITKTFSIA